MFFTLDTRSLSDGLSMFTVIFLDLPMLNGKPLDLALCMSKSARPIGLSSTGNNTITILTTKRYSDTIMQVNHICGAQLCILQTMCVH